MKVSFSTLDVIKFCFAKFFEIIRSDKNLLSSFFVAITVFIFAIAFNVSLPLILKFILHSLENSINNHQLIIIAVFSYGFMWTVAQIGEHIREIASVRAIERVLRNLTLLFYQTAISQTNPHKGSISTGSTINRLAVFRDGFQNLIWGLLFFLLPTLIEIICACFILWNLYGVFYSVALFITITLYSICTAYGVSHYLKYQNQALELSSQVSGFLSDRLFNIETVNYFGNPEIELSLLNKKLICLEDKTTKTKQIFETVRVIQGIIIGSSLILVTYKSIDNILEGNQVLSDFILINSYVIQFFLPLSSLGLVMNDIYKSFAEVAGFFELIKPDKIKNLISGSILPSNTPPSLSAKDLCFYYDSTNFSFLLKNINISLEPGWKVGIVGSSGSGKSTLGKLLGGLYKPGKGELFFNDIPYSSYDSLALKKTIALAPQHVQLFYDTMLANILYANPEATMEELENALQAAQLKEVIDKLPNGLDTFIGEQGACLSGGEKQRIGIARAILKQPSLYILDEPTSFLDLKTEELILNYFNSKRKKVTQIVIAHRIHTIMDADWILIIENGRLISQGTPQYLIKNSQFFKELCELDAHEKK